jgi:hypothetical protein
MVGCYLVQFKGTCWRQIKGKISARSAEISEDANARITAKYRVSRYSAKNRLAKVL